MMPNEEVPIGLSEAEPQGNAMSVRITAAGAVAVALLAYLTAPVSACDERYIKKCEKASAAAATASEPSAELPAAKRKSAKRVTVVLSRHTKATRLTQRTRAPGFTVKRERGMTLASADSRMVSLPRESALSRRFRGFIDPQPIALNAFEALRKPHLVAENLELPVAVSTDAPAIAESEAPAQVAAATPAASPASAPAVITTAKQDRATPKPIGMELASAESKPVVLPEPPAPARASMFSANAAPAPAVPQAFVSEAPTTPQPSGFAIHHLVIALCGALGAAGALRFVVGA